MIQKGYLSKTSKRDFKATHKAVIVSKSMLLMGMFIILSALMYMMINVARADSIIHIWLPFIVAGVFLIFISQLITQK